VSATWELPRGTGKLEPPVAHHDFFFQPCTPYRESHDAVRDAGLGVGLWEDQHLM
jgi:hypothetical protein